MISRFAFATIFFIHIAATLSVGDVYFDSTFGSIRVKIAVDLINKCDRALAEDTLKSDAFFNEEALLSFFGAKVIRWHNRNLNHKSAIIFFSETTTGRINSSPGVINLAGIEKSISGEMQQYKITIEAFFDHAEALNIALIENLLGAPDEIKEAPKRYRLYSPSASLIPPSQRHPNGDRLLVYLRSKSRERVIEFITNIDGTLKVLRCLQES
jgi:hypothetical protein